MVYYRSGQAVAVNLYTASAGPSRWKAERRCGFGKRRITPLPAAWWSVSIPPRRPGFRSGSAFPAGAATRSRRSTGSRGKGRPAPGSTLTIDRRWNAGDRVTLDMPMTWRLVLGRKRQQAARRGARPGGLLFEPRPKQNASEARCRRSEALIVLDPKSLQVSSGGEVVRPGGVACQASAVRYDGNRNSPQYFLPPDRVSRSRRQAGLFPSARFGALRRRMSCWATSQRLNN